MTVLTTRPETDFDLASYAGGVDTFFAEIGEEYYQTLAGLKDDSAIAAVYERHAGLFAREHADALGRLADDDDAGRADRARQARLLREFATHGILDRGAAQLTDRITTAEGQATIEWQGTRIGYRAAPVRIAEIPDRAPRNALESLYHEAVEEINPLREERLARVHELAVEVGHRDYVDLYASIKGIDFDVLAVSLQEFLAESETVYFAALRRFLARIDIEQGDASRADLNHVLRGDLYDPWFRADRLIPALHSTLTGLGIDVGAQRNVTLDLEARPNKSPRAFCVAVRVPDDVRLVVLPRGGHDDYGALLHEAGHLEHFAHVDPAQPVAYRRVGDNSLTEGYAFVLEYLALEPAWLAEHIGVTEAEASVFLDFAAFQKLYMLRRYVAKLLYELRLHRGLELGLARAYYAGAMSYLTGVRYAESTYLSDIDDGLYSGQYLRAWMLEASVSGRLRARFGATWWRDAAAGEFLVGLWKRGQAQSAEEVVAELGYDDLDWRPVLRHVRTHLIGEMSGYGGPNITTRAGTRKV
ncbi:MAG: hypothetical protein M3295_01445 [Chloroflexota bacterium]|nr:hypothetical protein [Chloroflexota bacterium]